MKLVVNDRCIRHGFPGCRNVSAPHINCHSLDRITDVFERFPALCGGWNITALNDFKDTRPPDIGPNCHVTLTAPKTPFIPPHLVDLIKPTTLQASLPRACLDTVNFSPA